MFTEEDVAGRTVLPEGEILFRDRAGVRELLASLDDQVLVEVQHPFDIVHPRDDDPAEAASRFADAFRSIAWSDEAQRLVDFASAWNADDVVSALHVRGGDIVSGDWRHSMYYGKYMPLPYVTHAAEELTRGARPLLVLSDNAKLLAWLRRRFDSIVTAADIVPGVRPTSRHVAGVRGHPRDVALWLHLRTLGQRLQHAGVPGRLSPHHSRRSPRAHGTGTHRPVLGDPAGRTGPDRVPCSCGPLWHATSPGSSTCSAMPCPWASSSIWLVERQHSTRTPSASPPGWPNWRPCTGTGRKRPRQPPPPSTWVGPSRQTPMCWSNRWPHRWRSSVSSSPWGSSVHRAPSAACADALSPPHHPGQATRQHHVRPQGNAVFDSVGARDAGLRVREPCRRGELTGPRRYRRVALRGGRRRASHPGSPQRRVGRRSAGDGIVPRTGSGCARRRHHFPGGGAQFGSSRHPSLPSHRPFADARAARTGRKSGATRTRSP